MAGGLIALILGLHRYYQTAPGRRRIDLAFLALPVLGEVILKREIARFTRTFGALLRNGVPILNALDIAAQVMINSVIRAEVESAPESIAEGKGVAGTFRGSRFFPPVVTNMIAIGEETGNLPGVLHKVAQTYENQVDRSVKTLTSIIEPVIILVMGLIVGFIVIAMLLPIFELDPTAG
jgi:type II secretory pathway component PulF